MAQTREITASFKDSTGTGVENVTVVFKLNRVVSDEVTNDVITDDSIERITDATGEFSETVSLFCNDRAYGDNSYYIVTISMPGEGPRDYKGFVPEGDGSAYPLGLMLDPTLNITRSEAALYGALVAAKDEAEAAADTAVATSQASGIVDTPANLPAAAIGTKYVVARDFSENGGTSAEVTGQGSGGMALWEAKVATTAGEAGWGRITHPLATGTGNGDMLKSVYDSDDDGKVAAEPHSHDYRYTTNYLISGEIKVQSGDNDIILGFFNDDVLESYRAVIESGTSATVKLQTKASGGAWTDVTGSSAIITTTAQLVDCSNVTLAAGSMVRAVVTAVSGTPKHLTIGLNMQAVTENSV